MRNSNRVAIPSHPLSCRVSPAHCNQLHVILLSPACTQWQGYLLFHSVMHSPGNQTEPSRFVHTAIPSPHPQSCPGTSLPPCMPLSIGSYLTPRCQARFPPSTALSVGRGAQPCSSPRLTKSLTFSDLLRGFSDRPPAFSKESSPHSLTLSPKQHPTVYFPPHDSRLYITHPIFLPSDDPTRSNRHQRCPATPLSNPPTELSLQPSIPHSQCPPLPLPRVNLLIPETAGASKQLQIASFNLHDVSN